MLAFDNSGSIVERDRNNWNYMIDYATSLVSTLPLSSTEYQVGALLFGNSGRIKIALDQTTSNAELTNLITDLNFQAQRTNLESGLYATRVLGFSETNGARSNSYKVAVFLYDGEPTHSDFGTMTAALEEAPKLKEAGVEVFVYSLKYYIENNKTSIDSLNTIGSKPYEDHVFVLDNWEGLAALSSSTLNTIAQSCASVAGALPTPEGISKLANISLPTQSFPSKSFGRLAWLSTNSSRPVKRLRHLQWQANTSLVSLRPLT